MEGKQRSHWIDIAKGIGIISVVCGHMGWNSVIRVVFLYHLPLFFILTGYLLKQADDFETYACDKFHRLVKPYLLTCLVMCLFQIIFEYAFFHLRSIPDLMNTLYRYITLTYAGSGTISTVFGIETGGRIGATWFLPAMYFALLTSQIIIRTPSWKMRFFWGGVLYILSSISAKLVWFPFSMLCGFFSVIYILFGMWMKETDLLKHLKWPHYLLFLAVSIFVWYYGLSIVVIVNAGAPDLIVSGIGSVCASLILIRISQLIRKNSALEWLGRNSLTLMCVHLFEMDVMRFVWEKTELYVYPRLFIFMRFAFVLTTGILIVLLKTHLRKKPESSESWEGAAWLILLVIFILRRFHIDTVMNGILDCLSVTGPFLLIGMVLYRLRRISYRPAVTFPVCLCAAYITRMMFEKGQVPFTVSMIGLIPLLVVTGMWMKENDIPGWIRSHPWACFITATVFLYYCYINMRPQNPERGFSQVYFAAVSGYLLILQLSLKLSETRIKLSAAILHALHISFGVVYLMDFLAGELLRSFLSSSAGLFPDGTLLLAVCLFLEVGTGIVIGFAADRILLQKKRSAN